MTTAPDPRWPPASTLLTESVPTDRAAVALLGVPTFRFALSPWTGCDTPARVRTALARYSTWSYRDEVDLAEVTAIVDLGDVVDPDDGIAAVASALVHRPPHARLTAIVGGDNSATFVTMAALAGRDLAHWGLVTLDAHHDLRDGHSNGSPVAELLAAGLPGSQVVQVGLSDFANSPAYARRAADAGITCVTRAQLDERGVMAAIEDAVAIASGDDRPVYVDIDLDVCDRAVVPACPAAAPGGLSARELRDAVYAAAASSPVVAIDFTEVDAARDAPDGRTVRLVALALLEAVAGVAARAT